MNAKYKSEGMYGQNILIFDAIAKALLSFFRRNILIYIIA